MAGLAAAPSFETNRRDGVRPYFSICIPQYNRTEFLVRACETFAAQTFTDFEVCISDDCSNDGKEALLLEYLRQAGFAYAYRKTERNLRYDGNLRSAIAMSRGRYLFLMGNDDGLADSTVLQSMRDALERFAPVAVAISNYREVPTGAFFRRMTSTGVLGSGPLVAVETFRRYSFVSGIAMNGDAARSLSTDVVDGTEMYQMYVGSRLIAAGGRFLSLDSVYVDKDLQIPGLSVESYSTKPRAPTWPIVERPLPMGRLLEVMALALAPCHSDGAREHHLRAVARQLYRFIYPYWVLEYRRVQSWSFALGVLLALRPSRITRLVPLTYASRVQMWIEYVAGGFAALCMPISTFDKLRPQLYAVAKRWRAT